jgi:hypothetical protein
MGKITGTGKRQDSKRQDSKKQDGTGRGKGGKAQEAGAARQEGTEKPKS